MPATMADALPPPDLDWFDAAPFGMFVHWDHASRATGTVPPELVDHDATVLAIDLASTS